METEEERQRWQKEYDIRRGGGQRKSEREVWIIDFQKRKKLNITEAQLCCNCNSLS